MVATQGMKFVNITPPAAIVDNTDFATTEIDTAGFDYLTVITSLGATDIAMTALKLQESDTAGSGHEDITGATFAAALPGASDDDKMYGFFIPLQGRKRYIEVVATAGNGAAGTYASILGILSRAEQCPDTAAERGLGGQVIL